MSDLATKNTKATKEGAGGRCAKYKPTGIPWLPEVPEGWKVRRAASFLKVKDAPSAPDEELLSVFLDRGVIRFSDGGEKRANATSKDLSKYQLVVPGDFVLNNQQAWRGSVGVSPYRGIVSPAYFVVQLGDCIDPRYANIAFRSKPFVCVFELCSRGVGSIQRNLIWNMFKQRHLPLPPLPTQRAIVAFLDEKCGKFDRLVAAKEKEVALLKELRERVIADAVTGVSKALSSGSGSKAKQAKFKPSGIPWLPEVPEGWEVKKVRQHFRLRSEKVSEKDYPPLSVAKIGVVPQLADVAISMAEGDTRKLVREGDYVVNSRSDRKGSCGIAPRDGSVTTISIVLEPHYIDRKYVHYLFRSTPWVEEFYRNGRGIVADLWTTRYQEMRNMMFPLPPLPEQKAIVAYIETRAAKIDAAVAGLEREIAALKEYKQRLIADVVTGQRRVA